MNRREFIKNSPGLVSLLGISCSNPTAPKNSDQNNYQNNEDKNPGNTKYIPLVNKEPYFPPEYSFYRETSDVSGEIGYNSKGKKYLYYLEDIGGRAISGLEAKFYEEDKFKNKICIITDPNERYLPAMFIPGKRNLEKTTGKEEEIITILRKDLAPIKKNPEVYMHITEERGLELDPDDVKHIPGFIYLGKRSFRDLKNLNTVLQSASLTLGIASSTPYAFAIFCILSKTGAILNGIERIVSINNEFNDNIPFLPEDIDLDKKYSIYITPNDSEFMLVIPPEKEFHRGDYARMRDLIPIEMGNWWKFDKGLYTYIEGIKKINGKKLVVMNSLGFRQYLGFLRNSLNQYGENLEEVGDIWYLPRIELGDTVYEGSSTRSTSRIISEKYPYITGKITYNSKCVGIEDIVLSNRKPFGNCFKMDINMEGYVTNGKDKIPIRFNVERWYAKNIGPVKAHLKENGEYMELKEANIVPRTEKPIATYAKEIPTHSRIIKEAIKKLI